MNWTDAAWVGLMGLMLCGGFWMGWRGSKIRSDEIITGMREHFVALNAGIVDEREKWRRIEVQWNKIAQGFEALIREQNHIIRSAEISYITTEPALLERALKSAPGTVHTIYPAIPPFKGPKPPIKWRDRT